MTHLSTITTLMDEVLPELDLRSLIEPFGGFLRQDFLRRIARVAQGGR